MRHKHGANNHLVQGKKPTGFNEVAQIAVLIVSDQPILVTGLHLLLTQTKSKMRPVGSAASLDRALELAAENKPDVVILDIDIVEGLQAISELAAHCEGRVVALTAAREDSLRDRAVLAGARGIVGKEEALDNVVRAIEKVHAGQVWLDRSATGRIFVEFSRRLQGEAQPEDDRRLSRLTRRELEITRLLVTHPHTSITQIAKQAHTSEHTLRNHLTSIYRKLGVKNRLQLHLFATKHRVP